MSLFKSFEKQGNFLFKYRGQIPVLLFLLAIPFIYLTDYSLILEHQRFYLFNIGLSFAIIGFFIRFYTVGSTSKGTSGRNTEKQVADTLNTSGVYSIVRHPLYLGNFLIWIGIIITTMNIYFIIISTLLFWIYYERIMYAEEVFLSKRFGEKFVNWSLSVPAFIPSFKKITYSSNHFSFISILRREYSSVLAATIGFSYIDLLVMFFNTNNISFVNINEYILISIFIIVLLLKFFKKYTNLIHEKNRS